MESFDSLEDDQKVAVDIEDIGDSDETTPTHHSTNENLSDFSEIGDSFVLELPPDEELDSLSDFMEIGDDIQINDLEDFEIGEQDLSEVFLQDTRRIEQQEDARAVLWILIARSFAYLGRHIWAFFIPVALGLSFPTSLLPAAAYTAWVYFAIFLTNPYVAQLVDNLPRKDLLHWGMFGRLGTLIVNGILVWLTMELASASDLVNNTLGYFSEIPLVVLFTCLLIGSSLNGFSGQVLKVCVEEEWVATMYPVTGHPQIRSKLKISYFLTQILSPFLVAPLFYISISWAILIVLILLVLLSIPELIILEFVVYSRNELRTHTKVDSPWVARDLFPSDPFSSIIRSWKRLKAQVLFLVVVANTLMSFWYLSVDATLFLSFMTVSELNLMWIAVFRSAVALISLLTSLTYPWIINKLSLVHSTRLCMIVASVLAVGSVPVIYFGPWIAFLLEILFLHALIVSYFVASEKLVKGLDIPIMHANQSLQSLMFVLMNLLGCVLYLPKLFSVFVWINMLCVLGATIAIFLWSRKKSNIDYVNVSTGAEIEFDDFDTNVN